VLVIANYTYGIVVAATYRIIDRKNGNVIYEHEITSRAGDVDFAVQYNIIEFLRELDLVNLNQSFQNPVEKKISSTKGGKGR
jgi:hypothetical protein